MCNGIEKIRKFRKILSESTGIYIVLIEGTAGMRFHVDHLVTNVLPSILATSSQDLNKFAYLCVLYGDYPPRSILTTQVAYIGSEYNAMASKLKDQIFLMQSFTGGSIIHNAIHEGLAAGLQTIKNIVPEKKWQRMEIVIASFSESYPQSQPIILTPNFCDHTTASNNIVDLLNKYLTDEKLSKLYLVSPTGRVKILESLLGPLFQLEKSKKEPVWYITEGIPIKKSTNVAYLNNGNPASSTHQLQDPLAKSISEFMNSVSNLPLEKRAAAVRDQIESPVFSADYKRHLISKVRSMSHLFKPCTTISTEKNSKKISEDSPVSENSIKRIWCGTLEFKLESTFSVQAIATHLANPKIIGKTLDIKDFYPETWPSRLKITGSIPLSSQLIHKFAPRSLFVEIGAFDLNCNDSMITLGSLYKFLDTRNLSGVIKIGEKLIVLIIPKGKGLVGMLINRDHFSSEMGHPNTAMQSSVHPNPKSEVQFGSIAKMNNNSTLNNAHQQPSKIPVEVRKLTLTPEDIIRQKLGLANSFSSTLSPANMSNSFSANSSFAPTRKPSPPPNLMIHDNRFTGNQRSPIKNHPNMSTAGVPTSNPMNGNINQMNDTRFGKLQGNNEISLDIDDLRCDLIDGNHGDHVTFYADDSFFG